MADLSLSFHADYGISIDDTVAIIYGDNNPSISGEDAPVGSLYLRTTGGELYQKVGTNATDWNIFSQGFDQLLRVSATDTTSGFLNNKFIVTSNLIKTLNNPGANETLTLDLQNVGTPGTYRSVTTDSKGRVTAGTNPTTLSGYGITDAQPLDSTLSALASFNTNGFVVQTGIDVFEGRQILGTTNQVEIINGDGASNPTISLVSTNLTLPGTQGVIVPSGTTAQRINLVGTVRYNTTLSVLEYRDPTSWVPLTASTGGTVTSVTATQPAAGITISGSPITTAGTLTFNLANDLAGVEGLSSTGLATRIATDSWTTRSITGVTNRTTITNGNGVSGNPTIDIASTYVGQTSITTLGTISTGTWSGTTIATNRGGTGLSSIGTANQVLGVNSTATSLEYKTVAATTGIGISATPGLLTLSNTGVTSITGTVNQVNASSSTGNVTLSLPQSISASSSPTFAQVTVASDPTTALQVATKQYVDNLVAGLNPKQSVRIGTTANITLSGIQTIDSITTVVGDRVLVKNQSAAAENGIYVVSAGAWTRATDLDSWAEVPGCFVFIEEGSTQADSAWLSTGNQGGTLGTTAMPWVAFTSAADITAGTGLSRTGNNIFITNTGVTAGSGYNNFTVNAQGQVTLASTVGYLTGNQTITLTGDATGSGTVSIPVTLVNTGVAAGTYRSVTVDTKGRVTAATNPTTLAGYGITDAQPLDADLTAIAAFSGTGIAVRTAADTWTLRSIVAGSTRIAISNGNGVGGNITVDATEANFTLNNIGGTLGLTKGGTNLTTTGTANQVLGMNAAGAALEYKTLTAGSGINITHGTNNVTISGNVGTVTSVGVTGSTGLSVGGSPITTAGTITLTLNTELQGLSGLSSLGLVTRTAAGTYTSRSVVSGVGTITITNPAGTAGNIGIDLTTVGTAGTYRSVTTDAFGRVTAGTNPTTLAGYGITDAINVSEKGVANGVATLDAGGLIPSSQLPPIAITDTFVVTSQAQQTALIAQVGDVAVRTDIGKSYILQTAPASTFSNWVEMPAAGAVTSVNGQTGNVTIPTGGSPGGVNTNVQFNNSGVFGGSSSFNFISGANPRVEILGTLSQNQLRIGGTTDIGTSTVYIESNNTNNEGQRVYFNSGTPATSGWMSYAYDGSTPYLKITDADDDPPYVSFETIGTGTYASPQYASVFGARGTYGTRTGGNNTGFSWHIGANTSGNALITANAPAMELDSQWLRLPAGTTAQRPVSPVNGMTRYNSTLTAFDFYQNGAWVQYYVLPQASANQVLVGPISGGPAIPTFRTLGIDELNDVTITSPQANQVLAWNSGSSQWVNTGAVGANASGLIGAGQAGAAAWTLVSGSTYRADFTHNLGTTNVVITVFNSSNNTVVIPQSIVLTSANVVRVTVVGNSLTLRVVVVANGQSIVAGGSTPSSVIAAKDGVNIVTGATKLNFVGQSVSVTDAGSGQANVTFGARYSYFANSLDTPNNSDWVINALAPVVTDPSFASMNIRQFSNTVEQGVGFMCSIPPGSTQATFKWRGRAQTAPGATAIVQFRLYNRSINNNSAVSAWSSAFEFANISIPTNAFFQYATQTISLATLGLVADRLYNFEMTRRVSGLSGGTNLAANFLLAEVSVEFS